MKKKIRSRGWSRLFTCNCVKVKVCNLGKAFVPTNSAFSCVQSIFANFFRPSSWNVPQKLNSPLCYMVWRPNHNVAQHEAHFVVQFYLFADRYRLIVLITFTLVCLKLISLLRSESGVEPSTATVTAVFLLRKASESALNIFQDSTIESNASLCVAFTSSSHSNYNKFFRSKWWLDSWGWIVRISHPSRRVSSFT